MVKKFGCMKNFLKFLFVLISMCIFPLLIKCTKPEPLVFLTEKDFDLSASAQEFDIKTKQTHEMCTRIVLNGSTTHMIPSGAHKSIPYDTVDIGGCSVMYKEGIVNKIKGEWFELTEIDDQTTHVSLLENNEGADRSLGFQLCHWQPPAEIFIKQRKK
jgi:hypothetical protein